MQRKGGEWKTGLGLGNMLDLNPIPHVAQSSFWLLMFALFYSMALLEMAQNQVDLLGS